MSTAVATRCPAWCSDHITEYLDGSFLAHDHELPVSVPEAWVRLGQEEDGQAFISLEVQGGNRWTPDDVMAFISTLVQAIWTLDPDYETPAEHDRGGLWKAAGQAVRARMGEAGLSQTEVAPMIGMSQPEVSIISRGVGVRTFTLNELAAIAEIIGCTLPELVEEIEAHR